MQEKLSENPSFYTVKISVFSGYSQTDLESNQEFFQSILNNQM